MESRRSWTCGLAIFLLLHGSSLMTSAESSEQLPGADDRECLKGPALDRYRRVAEEFQEGDALSQDEFKNLLAALQKNTLPASVGALEQGQGQLCAQGSPVPEPEGKGGQAPNCSQQNAECSTLSDIFELYAGGSGLNYTQLPGALQDAVLSLADPSCSKEATIPHGLQKPTTVQAWGYGVGFVCLVCIISNIGALLTPVMSTRFFQRLLQFLVAMGAGTLAATGLLVLIPEAFHIASCEHLAEDYVWKSATALISIYVFFTSERILKCLLRGKELQRLHRQESFTVATPTEEEKLALASFESKENHGHSHFLDLTNNKKDPDVTGKKEKAPIKTVAWMVLIGDVIHNFVDGLAIGAAFTENVYMGVSISIAVLCEELPHELGDVAILLHSGMSMKRALLLNFLSACVCFIGLVLGIVLGENTEANRWILAVAGGLFLYVPLVDMLPEMSEILDLTMKESLTEKNHAVGSEVKQLMFLQGFGLFLGMSIIMSVVYVTSQMLV